MSMLLLKEKGLDHYIQAVKDANNFWFFIHIPKTAGSSFGTEIRAVLRPNANIVMDYESEQPFDQIRREAMESFKREAKNKQFRFASGHIQLHYLKELMESNRNMKVITFLRNPVNRVVSDYRYARTPTHPPYKQFLQQYPTIEHYINEAESQNKMCAFLNRNANRDHVNVDELIDDVERNFAFVGVQELYPLSFSLFFYLLDLKRLPTLTIRKTEERATNIVEMTPDLIKKIRERNREDVKLYQHFRTILLERRDEWFRMLRNI